MTNQPSYKPPAVCGFSFGRNLTQLNYPVEAAVGSILPLCDHFVFAVGQSDDDTRQRIAAIDTATMAGGKGGKISIIDTQWQNVQVDGTVLSIEANKAMAEAQQAARDLFPDRCTWGFYIQADEVVHEDDLPAIDAAMQHWAGTPDVKTLLFRYLHFVLDYQTTDPWMYHKASRIVRLDDSCHIVGDACGPALAGYRGKVGNGDGYLDKNFLGSHVRWAKDPAGMASQGRAARVFHYGWVKTRSELDEKFQMVEKLWWGTLDPAEKNRRKGNKFGRFMDRYALLKKYCGSHPALMASRVAEHPPFAKVPSRWLNPRFYAEILRHGFHG